MAQELNEFLHDGAKNYLALVDRVILFIPFASNFV